ncbi:Chromosome transmission fidelity protein 18 [Candida viswanathii]|uniref:Chromosome transmission fidelity protein 18 n=1 Tax=Candida viswanathii TaxID=5486 RepID=A0A367YKG9_9ASCO|nr:Chromosome transmission fidelity protein 18 [Candida viswanathii]
MTSLEESQLLTDKDDFDLDLQESYLFSNAQLTKEDDEDMFDFSKSLLFQTAGDDQDDKEHGLEDINEEEPPSTGAIIYSATSRPWKTVKLFSGESIRLNPRVTTRTDIDETQLKGTYLDMDSLTTRANLRNSIKEQKRKQAETRTTTTNLTSTVSKKSSRTQIWTEKYKPNSFIQLCSAGNDKQYRLVLHWLKKWSHTVFREDIHDKDNVDTLGRPFKKILLIHGPTGIGKTAATHILANQMGYNVQELNASNSMDTLPQASSTAGSGSSAYTNASTALKLKIINALTSNSISSEGRPSCLIIDEIDSLTNASDVVKVLNDLVQSDQKALSKKLKRLNMDGDSKKKSKKKDILLNRPIICIANDIYSQQGSRFGPNPMDKLRPISEIVAFKKPMTAKAMSGAKFGGNAVKSVKDHLMAINTKEKLGLDYQEIGEVVEVCDSDIRACINHLQFNSRKVETVDQKVNSGELMDKQLSWFAMVDQLFKRDPQLSKDQNFDQLFSSFMSGEGKSITNNSSTFDKVLKGVFDKYLDVAHNQDDSLIKPSEFSDWVGYYAQFSKHNDTSEYFPLLGLKTWVLFSELNPQKYNQLLIPNAKNLDFEHHELLKTNKNTIKLISDSLPVHLKLALGINPESAATEFLPCLSKILSPSLSARLKSDLNDTEKKWVEKITAIVKDFDLSLENLKDLETGLVSLKINPSWDSITVFDNSLAPVPLASAFKQTQFRRQAIFPLVTTELDRLYMLRKAAKRPLDEEVEKEEPKAKKSKPGSSVNFFKGKYEEVQSQIQTNTAPTQQDKEEFKTSRIWVKYNEGFSNAVRKNIGWKDLWLV